MRKAIQRQTVDYHQSMLRWMEERVYLRSRHDTRYLRPDPNFIIDLLPPAAYLEHPNNAVATKFIHTSTNKVRYPVNVVRWTPEGRRLITGSSSGEFTLWNGLTFNFETILQAHDSAVRAMNWTRNGNWMVTGDHSGIIKYWQSNMNNLKLFQAHKEAVRDLSFAPSDTRFATCSDDSLIKIWDFTTGTEERALAGHGWDVKCVDWHPQKALLASGSKDNLIKLWDPRSTKAITTLHGHKNTILALEWNQNGNWMLSAGRDQMIKVFDIRAMKEVHVLRGQKEVCSARWHPQHERLFATGGSEGALLYWLTGEDEPVGKQETAHDSNIWSMDWHPVGHILVTGSNDHTTRFWTRPRPGETTSDKFESGMQQEHSQEDAFEPPPFRPNAQSSGKADLPPFRSPLPSQQQAMHQQHPPPPSNFMPGMRPRPYRPFGRGGYNNNNNPAGPGGQMRPGPGGPMRPGPGGPMRPGPGGPMRPYGMHQQRPRPPPGSYPQQQQQQQRPPHPRPYQQRPPRHDRRYH
ncbi:WD40 repeat-like protein [Hesseltinella vesiculosa]|uniref:Polyadenylation factor subunit 2 n=1 Tax=Hesseltinella vesiculosa TaxID=101127 RepID=A0A1X2GAL1_9FUNG|nr:WD40 repeat-like protein [Hesseltinella vesiculosa]